MSQSVNKWNNHKSVSRTALATPGLLTTFSLYTSTDIINLNHNKKIIIKQEEYILTEWKQFFVFYLHILHSNYQRYICFQNLFLETESDNQGWSNEIGYWKTCQIAISALTLQIMRF